MLRLVVGRSGTGKTHTIFEQLCDAVWAGREDVILLVPEQFSFESERTLLARLGPRLAGKIQVLSFTRMAETVMREVGGLAGRRMDDAARALLMSRAIEQSGDYLSLFRRCVGDAGTVASILTMIREMVQCGITASRMEQAAESISGASGEKIRELALIYGAYEALTAGTQQYIDPDDDLTMLSERLRESTLAAGALVFVDGFKGFTGQEMAILGALMKLSENITVALCCDPENTDDGGIFAPVVRTAQQLRDMARKEHVLVAADLKLEDNRRAAHPALAAAEAGVLCPRSNASEVDCGEVVSIAACEDVYAECDFVARSIRRYLREEDGRCRDIAVVARNLEPYRGVLDAAMEKQGITFLMDEREDILTQPLTALMLSALDAVTGGFRTDDLLCLLKTGLAGFSAHSVALLENYVLMWGISGRKWRDEWTWNPLGLAVAMNDSARKQLWYLNLLRRRFINPLERLRERIYNKDVNGRMFSGAVYDYLVGMRVPLLLRLRVMRLDAAGEPALADRTARLWEVVMGLLDRVAAVLDGGGISPERMTALLRLAAGLTDFGAVPQSLDAVQVGVADRIRFSSPKAVYILGANEGVFPAWPSGGGMLADSERQTLAGLGLPLHTGTVEETEDERLLAYLAVAAPSHRLIVSYVTGDVDGTVLSPSALVKSLRRIFPNMRTTTPGSPRDVESERDAFECAAARWTDGAVDSVTLREIFRGRDGYERWVAVLDKAAAREPVRFADDSMAKRLFGNDMKLSASRVEIYHQCRFRYFCQYGVKAQPRRPAEVDGLTYGTVMHYVMENVLPAYVANGYAGMKKERIMQDAGDAVRRYVDEVMGGTEDKPKRFIAQLNLLVRVAGLMLWRIAAELAQSQFVPVDYELSIGMEEDGAARVLPIDLALPDGGSVRVIGKVDRVDICEQNGKRYVRIVDYKSSSKELVLSDVVEGINVQMLIYLFTLWQNGGARYGDVTPAGVLYLPAALPIINEAREMEADKVQAAQMKKMKMNGIVLDDPDVIRAMEIEAAGVFIPAALRKDGTPDSHSRVASLEQFGLLKKRMEQLIENMAETLRGGDVAAIPTISGSNDACKYCDYYAVCGFEQGDSVRFVANIKDETVFQDLGLV